MAFTGDLENLHIVDIIQLLHATRKSGTFSVTGEWGESRIIFSNGYIVGASHLNDKVRIGSILEKMNAITADDLAQALDTQKKAGKGCKPLLATLIDMGRLKQEDAFTALKKLIEVTIVELIGWSKGAFSFDTDAIPISRECSYMPGEMDQVVSLDAQMVLMDALRVYDERERDRASGEVVPDEEEMFGGELPPGVEAEEKEETGALSADDLGLGEVEHLEKRERKSFSVEELFDPREMHRQTVREILADFSPREQDAVVAFLERSDTGPGSRPVPERENALIIFSRDRLLKHAVMTMYRSEGVPVFATDDERELGKLVSECMARNITPTIVYDSPDEGQGGMSGERIISVRKLIRESHPRLSVMQLASPLDNHFTQQSLRDGVNAVLPKPVKGAQKNTFIEDMIQFLETLKTYVQRLLQQKNSREAG